jgi:hypothetical protein
MTFDNNPRQQERPPKASGRQEARAGGGEHCLARPSCSSIYFDYV